ncbi:MAG: phosphodiesterase [bacterium]|nr:phosphodiesterase [bacterium]
MSLIGITSDIHGSKIAWDKLFYSPISDDIDLWIISGDILYHGPKNPIPEGYSPLELASAINEYKKPLIIVKGNCDSEVDQTLIKIPIMSPYGVLFIDGLKILIHHGDKNLDNWIFSLEDDDRFNIVISGHTHIPLLQKRNGVIFLNPGSPSIPLGEVREKTFSLLNTSKRSIDILNLEGKTLDSLIF